MAQMASDVVLAELLLFLDTKGLCRALGRVYRIRTHKTIILED